MAYVLYGFSTKKQKLFREEIMVTPNLLGEIEMLIKELYRIVI